MFCLQGVPDVPREPPDEADRPLVDLYVELAGFSNDAGGCQTPSFCAFV